MDNLTGAPAPASPEASLEAAAPAPDAGSCVKPYESPTLEDFFQRSRAAHLGKEKGLSRSVVFMVTLVLFVLFGLGERSGPFDLVVLVGVLLFHELGHLAGMKLFGYRDLRMFFIPLFGAAVSGTKLEAPVWQKVVVSLLGPLPGILAGLGFAISYAMHSVPGLEKVALMLLLINGFNLLPIVPLDGGRVLQAVLFSRHRVVEIVFLVLAAGALGVLAFWSRTWVLGLVALLGLMALPSQARRGKAVAQLRAAGFVLPADPAAFDEQQQRVLFAKAYGVVSDMHRDVPNVVAAMKGLHERLLERPPGGLASVALLAVWGFGFLATAVGVIVLAVAGAAAS